MEHESYESWDEADSIVMGRQPEPLLSDRLDEEEVLEDLWELDLLPEDEEGGSTWITD